MALTGTIAINVNMSHTKAGVDLSTPKDSLARSYSLAFADGTAVDQADEIYHDQVALAASANTTLDLTGGLTDAFGTAITGAEIACLIIKNNDTVTTLSVGNATNAVESMWESSTDAIIINPLGVFMIGSTSATGHSLTATTADELKLTRGAGTVTDNTFDIIIVLRSA